MSDPLKKLVTMGNATASAADPMLSPKLERARAKLLSALGNLSLLDALAQLRDVFEDQKTEEGRLANLAAQTWIMRRRLEALQKGQVPVRLQDLLGPKPDLSAKFKLMSLDGAGVPKGANSPPVEEAVAAAPEPSAPKAWQKVRILAEAEVNGMVFFEGSTIAVKVEDAEKLVSAGKAEVVDDAPIPPSEATAIKAKRKPKSTSSPKETP